MTKKQTFKFTLVLEGADITTDENGDALYEAGCDDAVIGRVNGRQFADFSREASSFAEAVKSAIENVESAIEGLRVVRVEREEPARQRPRLRERQKV